MAFFGAKVAEIAGTGLLLAVGAGSAYAHGGGLDGHGCHHNRREGGYHCHQGPLAGQSFSSQQEMLQKLNAGSKSSADKK